MDSRVLVMFVTSLVLLDSRSLALDHAAVKNILNVDTISLTTKESPQLCQLCEQFATEALFYLKENETQIEIIDTLHQTCSKFRSFKLECTKLVDYYAPLFFTKIASLSPEEFCVSASLCAEITFLRLRRHEDACTLCHEVVDEVLTDLEDPEMELKIIEILLKGCNNADNFVQKCKRLIIQNAPVYYNISRSFLRREISAILSMSVEAKLFILEKCLQPFLQRELSRAMLFTRDWWYACQKERLLPSEYTCRLHNIGWIPVEK